MKCDNAQFKQEYGFDYGEDSCMMYFYPCGVLKALRALKDIEQIHISDNAYRVIKEGVEMIPKQREVKKKELTTTTKLIAQRKDLPIQINIQVVSKQ